MVPLTLIIYSESKHAVLLACISTGWLMCMQPNTHISTGSVHFYRQPRMRIDQLAQASRKSESLTRKMDQ
jgi:hypothetical protein